jgi:rhodanese-related sulfurtransferase
MQDVSRGELEQGIKEGGVLFDTRPRPQPIFDLKSEPLSLEALQRGDVPKLPHDTPLYLVCGSGQASELAGHYLEAAGFTRVYHLAGGTKAWPF